MDELRRQIRELREQNTAILTMVNLMEQIVNRRNDTGPDVGGRRKIQMRDIKVENFEGGVSKWGEWSFQTRSAVAAVHKELYDSMKEAEKTVGLTVQQLDEWWKTKMEGVASRLGVSVQVAERRMLQRMQRRVAWRMTTAGCSPRQP